MIYLYLYVLDPSAARSETLSADVHGMLIAAAPDRPGRRSVSNRHPELRTRGIWRGDSVSHVIKRNLMSVPMISRWHSSAQFNAEKIFWRYGPRFDHSEPQFFHIFKGFLYERRVLCWDLKEAACGSSVLRVRDSTLCFSHQTVNWILRAVFEPS